MKVKVYLLLIFLSGYVKLYSQSYTSMINPLLEWQSCFNYIKDGQSTNGPIKYRFINKDTILKNDTFKLLMAYTPVDTFVMGGLKEDTIERKIYGFYSGDSIAYLMYDFSFPLGPQEDTLWIDTNDSNAKYRISVRQFQDLDGITRLKSQLCCGYSYYNTGKYKGILEWIEGLGSSVGVIHNIIINRMPQFQFPNTPIRPLHFLGIRKISLIGSNNPYIIYPCNFDTSLVSVNAPSSESPIVKISSISNDALVIESNLELAKASIYSIEGKLIKDIFLHKQSSTTIGVTDLSSGWYLLKILTEKEITYFDKFVKF